MPESQELLRELSKRAPAGERRSKGAADSGPDRMWNLLVKATANARAIPRRVLFVRSDAYGDCILFTSVLARLQEYWQSTQIGLVMRAPLRDLAPLLPKGVSCFFTEADPSIQNAERSPHREEVERLVREFSPDLLVAPSYEKTWLHVVAALASPAAMRLSLGPFGLDPETEEFLNPRVAALGQPLFHEVVPVEKELHELIKNERLLSHLVGARTPLGYPALRISEEARAESDRALAGFGLTGKGFVLCNPAGNLNVPIKLWPPDHYKAALRHLLKKTDLALVICAQRGEESTVTAAVAGVTGAGRIHTWFGASGQYPVLAGMAARARLYFGADTSTLHLCEALGVPVVGIYGGGHGDRFLPYLPSSIAVSHPLPCAGCNWNCHIGKAHCLTLIQPVDVIAALDRALAGKAEDRKSALALKADHLSHAQWELYASTRRHYDEVERDRHARFIQILELTTLARTANARLEKLRQEGEAMAARHRETEAALSAAHAAVADLHARLDFSEKDSGLRLKQIETLTAVARTQEAEAGNLRAQIATLNEAYRQLQHDLAQRQGAQREEIETLQRKLADEAAHDARDKQAHQETLQERDRELLAVRGQLEQLRGHAEEAQRNFAQAARVREEIEAASQAAVTGLQSRLDFSEKDSGLRLKQIETLTALARTQETEADNLRAQIAALNEACRQLQQDLAERHGAQRDEIETLRRQLADEAAHGVRDKQAHQEELQGRDRELLAARGQLEQLRAQVEEAQRSFAQAARRREEIEAAEGAETEAAAAASQAAIAQLQSRLDFSEKDSGLRLKQIETLTALARTQETEADNLRAQIVTLNETCRQLQHDLAEAQRNLAQAARRGEEIEAAKGTAAQAAAAASQAAIAELQSRLDFSERDSGLRLKQIETLTALARTQETEAENLRAQIVTLNEACRQLRQDLAGEAAQGARDKQAHQEALRRQNEADAEIIRLRSQADDLRGLCSEYRIQAEKSAESIQAQIAAVNARAEELAQEKAFLQARVSELEELSRQQQAALESRWIELEAQKAELSQKQADLEGMEAARRRVQGRADELDRETAGLRRQMEALSASTAGQEEQIRALAATSAEILRDKASALEQLALARIEGVEERSRTLGALHASAAGIAGLVAEQLHDGETAEPLSGREFSARLHALLDRLVRDGESGIVVHGGVEVEALIEMAGNFLYRVKQLEAACGRLEEDRQGQAVALQAAQDQASRDAQRLELTARLLEVEAAQRQALESAAYAALPIPAESQGTMDGHMDECVLHQGVLLLRGWCLPDPSFTPGPGPRCQLEIETDGRRLLARGLLERRPDVVAHFQKCNVPKAQLATCGFISFVVLPTGLKTDSFTVRIQLNGLEASDVRRSEPKACLPVPL